jgi:hypothetical protein
VFYKRAGASESSPTTSDSGTGQVGQIIGIRGCVTSGDPFDATAGSFTNTADTSGVIPGVTTTVANTLLLYAIGIYPGTNNFDGWFSGWTNANLTSLTERMDRTWTYGGFGLATGFKATAGASGNTTVTIANTLSKMYWCGALKPA